MIKYIINSQNASINLGTKYTLQDNSQNDPLKTSSVVVLARNDDVRFYIDLELKTLLG